MFCSKCGFQLNTGADFCINCGEGVKTTVSETVSTSRIVSYDEFYAQKMERIKRFEPNARPSFFSAKERRFAPTSTATLSQVSINVDYMQLNNEGKLKNVEEKIFR